LAFAKNPGAYMVKREGNFSPVKNLEGADSPVSARTDISKYHVSLIQKAGGQVNGSGLCEISPLLSYNGEGLENQVQGKESTDIPNDIFEKILNEIKKEKIHDTKNITYSKMREILKRLRINKYYEHINYIINRINGIPTPQFSTELEEKLCSMFKEIQGPFLKHCPKDRKNFLSYSYVLYKFFQILGLNEYLKFFPLLKSREKLYVQDQIWKKICEELNYKVIPSL
jgi:hypothetical protein